MLPKRLKLQENWSRVGLAARALVQEPSAIFLIKGSWLNGERPPPLWRASQHISATNVTLHGHYSIHRKLNTASNNRPFTVDLMLNCG